MQNDIVNEAQGGEPGEGISAAYTNDLCILPGADLDADILASKNYANPRPASERPAPSSVLQPVPPFPVPATGHSLHGVVSPTLPSPASVQQLNHGGALAGTGLSAKGAAPKSLYPPELSALRPSQLPSAGNRTTLDAPPASGCDWLDDTSSLPTAFADSATSVHTPHLDSTSSSDLNTLQISTAMRLPPFSGSQTPVDALPSNTFGAVSNLLPISPSYLAHSTGHASQNHRVLSSGTNNPAFSLLGQVPQYHISSQAAEDTRLQGPSLSTSLAPSRFLVAVQAHTQGHSVAMRTSFDHTSVQGGGNDTEHALNTGTTGYHNAIDRENVDGQDSLYEFSSGWPKGTKADGVPVDYRHNGVPFDCFKQESESDPATGNLRQTRRRLTDEERVQTGWTRQNKACIRCRMQRTRCQSDENDPTLPCVTCSSYSVDSKKTVHRLPCLRYKISEVIVSRTDDTSWSLGLTKRWQPGEMRNLGDWAETHTHTILITTGFPKPIPVVVRKFDPKPGDVIHRFWNGGQKKRELPPYGLADIYRAASEYQSYISSYAFEAIVWDFGLGPDDEHSERAHRYHHLVRETYGAALRHFANLDPITHEKTRAYIFELFKLWLAVRYTVGSSWIVSEDTLSQTPEDDDSSPLYGKVSTPRMVVEQWGRLSKNAIIDPLRRSILGKLEKMIKSNNPQDWFTVYISIFILLHETSIACRDRSRHAKQNEKRKRYTLPEFVQRVQDSGNILLGHWHYYLSDPESLRVGNGDKWESRLSELSPEQFALIGKTQALMDGTNQSRNPDDLNHEHELYWVSQMFEQNWRPRETFQA